MAKSITAAQLQWREWVRRQGCCVSNEDYAVQIHHVLGREAKSKGVGNIGHWYILPLSWRYHDVASDDPFNVTHHKRDFEREFSKQSELFHFLVEEAMGDPNFNNKNIPPKNVVEAILGWVR